MGRLALCAGLFVLVIGPTPSLHSLRGLAGAIDIPSVADPKGARAPSPGDVSEYDPRVSYECLGLPRGGGESSILAVAQSLACRTCGAPDQACRFICREVVAGQPMPAPVSRGSCD